MRRLIAALLLSTVVGAATTVQAADPESCRTVRISDLGWTDIALTSNTAAKILTALGYQPEMQLLGLNVTYEMLKKGDLDVFLGNWRPIQDEQFKSYYDEGSVVPLAVNLEGAKYTLAVPKYVADAGVKSFDDLAAHADQFGSKIYAIEPGSNQALLDMVAADRHGLGKWEIVESSEAAMLAQVDKSIPKKEWVVFLGWEPHPMNMSLQMEYLAGGDLEFGPNFGGATVRTIARKDFSAECPNAARLFSNLVFDLAYENVGMDMIMNKGETAENAAVAMMAKHPEKVEKWLDGVTTFDGQPGLAAVKTAIGE
ncbi:choline ABC transporter substrate-binding protein [Aquamicrobium soli]|jgi:glycine betaine/proline transport system substrate-binding protein|uniref:Choline ABC transporter substrate-binding protein n=1 Tax=Aquamicrobium soli TaxID=1811518 RepID=A0ABV7KB40_9HYPH